MSVSREQLLQLMAYVDGEIDDGERAEILALLAKSEEARRIVEQQSAVGEWVRASADPRAIAAVADGIASAVMSDIAGLADSKVAALDRARTKSARSRERRMAFGVLTAIAAAVSLVYLWPHGSRPPSSVAVEKASATGSVAASPADVASGERAAPAPLAAAEPEELGTDVQAVESPHHPVSIFYVPAATGPNAHASSVVVWIGEE